MPPGNSPHASRARLSLVRPHPGFVHDKHAVHIMCSICHVRSSFYATAVRKPFAELAFVYARCFSESTPTFRLAFVNLQPYARVSVYESVPGHACRMCTLRFGCLVRIGHLVLDIEAYKMHARVPRRNGLTLEQGLFYACFMNAHACMHTYTHVCALTVRVSPGLHIPNHPQTSTCLVPRTHLQPTHPSTAAHHSPTPERE
jgi:hypothetical protein